jgi:hypothetical protein
MALHINGHIGNGRAIIATSRQHNKENQQESGLGFHFNDLTGYFMAKVKS